MTAGWRPALACVAALGCAPPAAAQQAAPAADFLVHPALLLPRSTETGKPLIYSPLPVARADRDERADCAPALPCRMQLLGVIKKNGAVELRGTALAW